MNTGAVKRKDLGIAGTLIILSHAFANYQTNKTITNDIASLHDEIQEMRLENEKYFIRRIEVEILASKMDKMNEKLVKLTQALRDYGYRVEKESAIIGCSVEKEPYAI